MPPAVRDNTQFFAEDWQSPRHLRRMAPDMPIPADTTDRSRLLDAAFWFVEKARPLPDVARIALVGSICQDKANPKDVDLLVTMRPGADLAPIARLARGLMGRIQRGRLGADVFLVENGRYIGRACRYREPWPRRTCSMDDLACDRARPFLCDTSRSFSVRSDVVRNPPVVLWPEVTITGEVPEDVRRRFELA